MDMKLLEDFLSLSDLRNFSRAAEARNITQSTLSKRIRALEHWVGAALVDRSTYPIDLTPEGAAMVPQAREIVARFHGMRTGVRAVALVDRNIVRVAALHTLRVAYLPQWRREVERTLGPLHLGNPGSCSAYAQTLRQFRNGENDLLLTYAHPSVATGLDPARYETLTLRHDRLVPVSAPAEDGRALHHLDAGGVVQFLSYGTASFFAQALAPLLNARPRALNVVATNAMSIGLQSLAEVGGGLAWIPEVLVADHLADGRLVMAGGPDWTLDLTVQLIRARGPARGVVQRVWDASRALAAAGDTVIPLRARGQAG
ncbi:LysR family transcriptional regulator [Falsirhodobacter halotolerans]|uniref:LysR family transcriptional regulator n=1 Tax=Falsirhodobacter halotolerans TaxID=1146892 RepID=UPI001FD2C161|nr:LysR family transcriptional regulator [Falsirhodobacter halotolerans]MCJ8140888.1 LysR family transcriptional regulator [Falsirhodobacter halotolerans]